MCDLASSPCLFIEGLARVGPRGCVRTSPRVSLQNSQPGQGHFGGRLWPARRARPLAYFRGPAPHRQLAGGSAPTESRRSPSLGKAVAHHGLSSASLSPPSDLLPEGIGTTRTDSHEGQLADGGSLPCFRTLIILVKISDGLEWGC